MTVQIYIDSSVFNGKPQAQDIGAITNRIAQHKRTMELKELAVELTQNGKSVMLATYHSKPSVNNEIEQQQVLMLDFDNKDFNNQFSFSDAINNEFITKNACFLYKTFGNNDSETDKFRAVFVLNQPFSDNDSVAKAYYVLLELFPQADRVTTNPNRLFFGSNAGYTEINFNNRLSNDWLVEQYYILKDSHVKTQGYLGTIESQSTIIDNTRLYDLLTNLEYEKAKEIIEIKYRDTNILGNQFKSESSAHVFYKSELDLVEFLDLPSTPNFCCILTDESNPSASTYLSKSKIQIYNNFATGYKADIVKLVARLTGKTTFESVELLMYLTNSKLIADTDIQRQIRATDFFIESLTDADFKYIYPKTYKYFGRNSLEITTILRLITNYKYIDNNGNITIMAYLTLDNITYQVSEILKFKVTKETITKCISLLALTEILIKQSIGNTNKNIINQIDTNRDSRGISFQRYPNFITINAFNDLEFVEQVFLELESKNFTIAGGLNFEWLYANFSKEIALKVFPQKFVSTESNEITDDLVINTKSQAKINQIMAVINTYFTDHDTNYIKNSTLAELLKLSRFPKVEKNLGKYRNFVAQEFGNYYSRELFLEKGTQELKEKLNIPKSERITGYVFYFKT